jgi:hypothetical protein
MLVTRPRAGWHRLLRSAGWLCRRAASPVIPRNISAIIEARESHCDRSRAWFADRITAFTGHGLSGVAYVLFGNWLLFNSDDIAKRLGIERPPERELAMLKEDVAPTTVLQQIEEVERTRRE